MENWESVPKKKSSTGKQNAAAGTSSMMSCLVWTLISDPERETFGRQAYHREFSADRRGRGLLCAVRGHLSARAPVLPAARNGDGGGRRTGAGCDGHRLPARRRGAREGVLQRVAVQGGEKRTGALLAAAACAQTRRRDGTAR